MNEEHDLVISQVKHLKEILAAPTGVTDKERVEITLDILQEIVDGEYHDPRKPSTSCWVAYYNPQEKERG
jgi:hypothetical protein